MNPANYSSISFPFLGIEVNPPRILELGPLVVPINIISEFGSFSFILFAIAKPGFICPPVPAAATITFILYFLSI